MLDRRLQTSQNACRLRASERTELYSDWQLVRIMVASTLSATA
jgi:hypothetical protein